MIFTDRAVEEARREGHRIVVRQWYSLSLQGGEELVIDGIPARREKPSRSRWSEEFHGNIQAVSGPHWVRARLKQGFFGLRCAIKVDGAPVPVRRRPFDKTL